MYHYTNQWIAWIHFFETFTIGTSQFMIAKNIWTTWNGRNHWLKNSWRYSWCWCALAKKSIAVGQNILNQLLDLFRSQLSTQIVGLYFLFAGHYGFLIIIIFIV